MRGINNLTIILERIEKDFPWYKVMNRLMGASPIVDRSAIAHSGTVLDLSVLQKTSESKDTIEDVDGAGSDVDSTHDDGGEMTSNLDAPAPKVRVLLYITQRFIDFS